MVNKFFKLSRKDRQKQEAFAQSRKTIRFLLPVIMGEKASSVTAWNHSPISS
jgi:hypothetical protein